MDTNIMQTRAQSNAGGIGRLALPGIFLLALALRLAFFTGMEGSDDLEHARIAHLISEGRYHPEPNTFFLRYGLLLPLAFTFKLFGVREGTAVLPTLLASLGNLVLAYTIGRLLFHRTVGTLAALLLAFFPLDILLATTVGTDPIVEFWGGVAALCLLKARDTRGTPLTVFTVGAGMAVGLAYLTKETGLLLLPGYLIWSLLSRERWRAVLSLLVGLGGVLSIELLYSIVSVHDPFLRVHYFQGPYVTFIGGLLSKNPTWKRLFLEYPMQFFNPRASHAYGLFYPAVVGLLIVHRQVCHERSVQMLLIWWGVSFLTINFTPMRLWPFTPLLVAIPRYLAPLSIPLVVLLAALMARPLVGAHSARSVALLGVLFGSSFFYIGLVQANHTAGLTVSYHVRQAARFLRTQPEQPIFTDHRTADGLKFFFGYRKDDLIHPFSRVSDDIDEGYVVVSWKQLYALERAYREPIPEFLKAPPPDWRVAQTFIVPVTLFERLRLALADVLHVTVAPVRREPLLIYAVPSRKE